MLKLLEEGRELNFLLAMLPSPQQSNYNSVHQANHNNNNNETMSVNTENDTLTRSSSRNSLFSNPNRNSLDDEWQMNYMINKRDGLYLKNIIF